MSYKYFFIVLEYITLSLHFGGHLCQNYEIISSCNGENLQIDCGGSGKIAIQRVFFGAKSSEDALNCKSKDTRKDPSCCRRGYDDCIFYNSITESVFKRVCSGRRSCLYRVQETKGRQCRSSDYMTVYYRCIPDSLTGNICSDDDIHAKSPIYLSNIEYPLPRTGASNCTCMIVKDPTHQSLALTAIEMYLFDPASFAQITLRTSDGVEQQFPLSYRFEGFREWTRVTSDNATISLLNTENKGDAYIWMEISSTSQSEEFISLYCGESLTKLLFPTEPEVSSSTDSTKTSTTVSTSTKEETSPTTKTISETTRNTVTETTLKDEYLPTTEIEIITFSGTDTPKPELKPEQSSSLKPITTPSTIVTTTAAQSTTMKPTTSQSTTMKPTTTQSMTKKLTTAQTTKKPTTAQSTTMKPTTIQRTTVNPTTVQSTVMEPSTTREMDMISTTPRPTPTSTTAPTPPSIPIGTQSSSILTSTQALLVTSGKSNCFEICHTTFGHGFTMALKSFMNPSKVNKFCGKIDDLLQCFRNNIGKCNSSLEKKQADMELSANLAGHHVICENNLKKIQALDVCFTKSFRKELTACDQLLYPFEEGTKEEQCMLKIELVGCVKNATEDCNDASLLELAENVSDDLFDYLYKTDDCDQDLKNKEKETGDDDDEETEPEPDEEKTEPEPSAEPENTDTTTVQPVVPVKTSNQKGDAPAALKGISHLYCLILAALSVGFSYF
uniref:Uncharacterized protein LOC111135755 isoform X1 n=1 Tax=Crassostrea virginica TaxID=6565 RepID=A0A8B8EPQ3_CRAVI|nr:uncharacterized protein LOC111135755 isoform X1 [Crassostrea virginica]